MSQTSGLRGKGATQVREKGSALRAVRPREEPEPGARTFVWAVWGLSVLAATTFVAFFGVNVPLWDDANIALALIGDRPITLGWLWEQCNEHRIALPKLILLGADHLAGNDIRAGMFLSVAALSALAAALIGLTARLRGGTRPTDALFPVLLLLSGHEANLLWSIQFAFVLPTVLGTAFLIPIVGRATWPGPKAAVLAGIVLALLPHCGATGLMFVPAMAAWLLGAAWAESRSGRPGARRRAARIAVTTTPGLVLMALYFRGFQRGRNPEALGGVVAGFRTGLQFLSGGVGKPAVWAWPWSGAATLGLMTLALIFLARAWVRRPKERPRIFGLAAFLAAVTAIATAVAWGRAWSGEQAGFQNRYVTMATPLWCWLALTFRLYAPPAIGGLFQNALFSVLCVLAWPNAETALEHGRQMAGQARALTRDLQAGVPAYRIVRRFTPYLHPSQDEVARLLPTYRRAGLGPFGMLRDSPRFRETRLPLTPTDVYLARWEGTTAHVTNVDPQITFTLPEPRQVAGIRIRYAHANPRGDPARFRLTWRHPGQAEYPDTQRYAHWFQPTGEGKESTIWIDDIVDQFRIQPDNQPCEFRIDEIVLLEL
jgi:hypothetical protein